LTEGNRIVADAEQGMPRSAFEGAGMAQDFYDSVAKISSGDWTEGLANAAGVGLAAKEFLADPLGKLISMGLGWVVEHVDFLRTPLDWVTGDQAYLDKMAATWTGISDELSQGAEDLDRYYRSDTDNWKGLAADTYRTFCADRVVLYRGLAAGSTGTARLFVTCKIILAVARTLIRELITDFVGKVASMLLRYPPPVTPTAIPEAVTMANGYAQKIVGVVKRVRKAFGNATEWYRNLSLQFARVRDVLSAADDIAVQTFDSAIRQGYRAGKAAARGVAAADRARRVGLGAIGDEVGHVASAARDAAVKELPEKAGIEIAKESAKTSAGIVDDDRSNEDTVAPGTPRDRPHHDPSQPVENSYLHDGPGPHRVSGDLSQDGGEQ
jgi:hypothetical protein